jgi:hypothetical protein
MVADWAGGVGNDDEKVHSSSAAAAAEAAGGCCCGIEDEKELRVGFVGREGCGLLYAETSGGCGEPAPAGSDGELKPEKPFDPAGDCVRDIEEEATVDVRAANGW